MFTPIGFFAPQGAAQFDPTLGGTLTVAYHWDFTDSSTMTLSGTDVTNITDKVGSITMVVLPSQLNGTVGPATFAGDKTTFTGANSYYKEANWVADEMKRDVDWTVVQFATHDFDSLAANRIIAPWGIVGTRDDGQGHQAVRQTQFTPNYDPYNMTSCLTGTYFFSAQRFDSGWTGKKQRFDTTTAQAAKNMTTFTYNFTGTQIGINLNNETICSISDVFNSPQSSGNGFQIGGRDIDFNGNWIGDMYHTIVYPSLLTQTNVNDLYASWVAFNA